MPGKILIIDDEEMFREDVAEHLRESGYECRTAADGASARKIAEEFEPELILTDMVMPGMSGLDLLDCFVTEQPTTPVLLITAHGQVEAAIEAFHRGACDYILKPVILGDLVTKCQRALEHAHLIREVSRLRRVVAQTEPNHRMVGDSAAMRAVHKLIESAAHAPSNVLITGESGTGKELVALAIHHGSDRRDGPFVAVNCAALSEHLLESELFGHMKGSFTGAHADHAGFFEAAAGGTLFLDEISEMPLSLQAKLLRAIEQREILRVGGTRPIPVKVRLLAASNRDLKREATEGRFRQDLLFRLRVLELALPPLRQRVEDVPHLVQHFIEKYNRELKRNFLGLDRDGLRLLKSYAWPGNVRELANAIERAMIVGQHEYLGVTDLPVEITGSVQFPEMTDDLRHAMNIYEAEHIRRVLAETEGNREEAARRMGINPSTLYRKMLGLQIRMDSKTPAPEP